MSGSGWCARRTLALVASTLALVLIAAPQAPAVRGQAAGMGIGILSVDGTFQENVTLPFGGNYYLTVATDDISSYVDASVVFNGTVLAQDNRSLSASTLVSLPAGDYSIALSGHGRAALGWDFTNGSARNFPDNQTLVAFLSPAGPRIRVEVSMGDAQEIELHLYDDGLVAAGNATMTASGPVDFVLPPFRESIAYLAAKVISGNPGGLFGLAWSSGPLNPPLDFTAWPLFLLWIVVPVAVAAVVLVLRHRGRRGPGMPP